jgi:hypothetical protein
MSAGDRHNLSPGAADVRDRFATDFLGTPWERPDVRKRWILRSRNEASVREEPGMECRGQPGPHPAHQHPGPDRPARHPRRLGLHDQPPHRRQKRGEEKPDKESWWDLNLTTPVAKMLDWFVRHHPDSTQWYIGEVMREAHTRWEIPAQATGRTLRQALVMDGTLDEDTLKEYFARVTPGEPFA